MITFNQAEQASKNFYAEEFFNSHFMSVAVTKNKDGHELIVYLHKRINSSNLPIEYQGLRVSYEFVGTVRP